ncbi:hypothetical protein [Arthrobacter sp. zg-Y1110]|uniref:hypothetical protein n=1 Tax=Arthrobacter sp. zg-Y1110 TaxID=2886932 RepID=UPI001D138803|nr:hypothetical protein [Arthrobacter sp. zg-Y1110]MCC3291261.1 hypothetical protein [Arthrobacter sp. zg-Y1110]UWX83687.1 hypothetical protein N2K99_09160 [Arthrobacter sp. zg-Y1110]
MTELTKLLGFRYEKDLEDYLEARLWLTGLDLLVIGRQVEVYGSEIDLLAIDPTGLIHIVELKVDEAKPPVVAQVLSYRRLLKRMNRKDLIYVLAHGRLRIDLAEAFQQRFGHTLPETVNDSPALMIIAASIHPKTADSILELLDEGGSITAFRYVVHSAGVSLVPCCRSDQDVVEGNHVKMSPSTRPHPLVVEPHRLPSYRVPVDESIRRFWLTHAQDFMPFATFSFVYGRYNDWVQAQSEDRVHLYQSGLFARQLSAITAESREWTRVYVAHRSDMAAYNTFMVPPSAPEYRASGHTLRAYKFNPVGPVSDPQSANCCSPLLSAPLSLSKRGSGGRSAD